MIEILLLDSSGGGGGGGGGEGGNQKCVTEWQFLLIFLKTVERAHF